MNGSVENDLSPFLPVFTEREIGDRSTSSTVWGQVRASYGDRSVFSDTPLSCRCSLRDKKRARFFAKSLIWQDVAFGRPWGPKDPRVFTPARDES
jgi:hypothetical protein